MALTDLERLQYEALLKDAESAYHALMRGGSVAEFHDQNGERIRYTAGNRVDLRNYINWLRGELGLCPMGLPQVGRPAGVIF